MASGPDYVLPSVGILFIVAVALTISYTVNGIGNANNSVDLKRAVYTVIGTNSALVFFMGILALLYLRANAEAFLPFTVIMLHVNFLLGLIAVSMSALQTLG
jgi:hypothetical protein